VHGEGMSLGLICMHATKLLSFSGYSGFKEGSELGSTEMRQQSVKLWF
jgi:hypothetical protein